MTRNRHGEINALKTTSTSFIAAHSCKQMRSLRQGETLIWISRAVVLSRRRTDVIGSHFRMEYRSSTATKTL
jgi:hypothetical protein